MGEMSKVGRLFGLVKHTIWAYSLFLYLLFLSIFNILASFLINL
jgi:hypothetical protein